MQDNTLKKKHFTALIAAAGRGNRSGQPLPKQYQKISGKPLLRYCIECFLSHPLCNEVWVIIDPTDAELFLNCTKGLNISGQVDGADTRSKSIYNGLQKLSHLAADSIILVHDAARPCIAHKDIDCLLDAFPENRAATLAVPVTSTLRKSKTDLFADTSVERDSLYAIQTPQAFYYGDILQAHEKHYAGHTENIATDDTTLVSNIGIQVKLVIGSPENIKITYPEDIIMVEKILYTNGITNTVSLSGIGFDVHAFDRYSHGPVRLCGIDIEHTYKLAGHSDADVGLHALTDAILGAIGEGDIGRHFPPSDARFKNMDSAIFLKHTIDLLQSKGGELNNIDLTLICEEPKITPHADKMRNRIAEITGLLRKRINVKATTTEQLGFTGRKEGIAAQAIVSITLKDDS